MNVRDLAALFPTINGQQISSLTASANSDPIDLSNFVEAMAFINMTAQSGTTPTLDCKVQYGVKNTDGTYTWVDSGDSFTQMTTTTGLFFKKLSANFGRYVRLVFTLGGTNPNYTFTAKLIAKS